MNKLNLINRRHFLANSMAIMGAGAATASDINRPFTNGLFPGEKVKAGEKLPWRVGAVAYGFEYSIALFRSKNRTGPRMDVFAFIDATRKAGGDVAQIFFSMIKSLNESELIKLREFAAERDIMLELHGGSALSPTFEKTIDQAAVLGSGIAGCSFGMLMRPNKIATLDEWDQHMDKCRSRLRQLVAYAATKDVIVAVENHLDFTVEELRDLMQEIDSPYLGVLFDVGNTIGTLDDPALAAEILGPYVVATHYKDFAIEEVTKGFRFTMVPLGAGSLNLPEITKSLHKHLRPGMGLSIEMINGQQFEVNWLEERFWIPFRNHSARNVAATLRHIRSKAIDINEFKSENEVYALPHDEIVQLELDRMTHCTHYLRNLLKVINT